MNFRNKITILLPVLVLLSGCYDRTDQTLSPPENARRVTVAVKVPDGITLLPMQMLYRSERCKTKSYNSSNEAYEIRGYNGFKQAFSTQGSNGIRQQRIAIDGGGPCQWQLNSIKVSFKIADDNPLVKGKEVIETSYIFDFGDYGLSDGYGTGRAKKVGGDLDLKTEFFPMIIINQMFNQTSLEMFGGDTDYEAWSRRYILQDTKKITIKPIFHLQKDVLLKGDEERGVGMVISYPDGSIEHIRKVKPDYEKLLSMK